MLKPRLIAVGDNCLDVYLAKNILTLGGNALNAAVHWYNLGAHARYFGAVGQDGEAEIILTALQQIGLDGQDIERCEGETAFTLIDSEAGERRFLREVLGVTQNYFPDPSRYQQLLSCDFVHLGTHIHPELLCHLHQDGVRFSIDLSNHPFENLELAGAELVFASGGEDKNSVDILLEKLKQKGAEKILITCGAHGAYYHEGGQIFYAPAHPIKVVDTCGAGDSFLACFVLSRFFNGQDAQSSLDISTSHAVMTCTHQGGFIQPIQTIPDGLRTQYSQSL